VKLIVDMVSLCIGIVLYQVMAGDPIAESYGGMYWCCVGAAFVWFNNGLHRKKAEKL